MIEVELTDRVLCIRLNRPEQRNALNLDTCRELVAAFDRADADSAVGSVLLQGKGSHFCSGMDLAEVLSADQNALADIHERLFTTIFRARKPIVAAIHVAAIAAGVGLAANAHFVVAAPDARFALTEIRIGLWPLMVFRSVARAVGERRATELSLSGRTFSTDEAFAYGLVTEIAADPLKQGTEIARQLAGLSSVANATGLEYVNRTRDLSVEAAAPIARELRTGLMASEDFAEGVRAFLEKRAAVWPSLKGADTGNGGTAGA